MAKTSVKIITLKHPLSPQNIEDYQDLREMYEQQGYALKGARAEGSIERIELHKTLDYNREERRAAKRSGQTLQHNQYKGILPDGYAPIAPDDPRHPDYAPAVLAGAPRLDPTAPEGAQ